MSTAERIRAAAAALFVERPYADVTVDQIAERADVTKGAVYHHYASKEGVYLTMLSHALDRARARHEAAERMPGTCRERLAALTRSFLGAPPGERRVLQLVRRDANAFDEPTRSRLITSYQSAVPDPILRILRDGMRDGEVARTDARLLAWSFVAFVEVLLTTYAEECFDSDDDKLRFLMDVFFQGCAWTARGAAA